MMAHCPSTGDRIVVAVEGELAALRDVVASPATAVVADLAGVRFIDSSGVHALLVANEAARQHESTFIVRGARPAVALVFDVLGLADLLTIESDGTDGHAQPNDTEEAPNGAANDRTPSTTPRQPS